MNHPRPWVLVPEISFFASLLSLICRSYGLAQRADYGDRAGSLCTLRAVVQGQLHLAQHD